MTPFSTIVPRIAALIAGSAVIGASLAANPAVAGNVHALLITFGLTTCNSPSPCMEIQNQGSGPAIRGDGTSGIGVYASANTRAGTVSISASGEGVTAVSQTNHGVQGTTNNPSNRTGASRFGVYGFDGSTDRGMLNAGVDGFSAYGTGTQGQSNFGPGVKGTSNGAGVAGVVGIGNQAALGVFGQSANAPGVEGTTSHSTQPGVLGVGFNGGDGVYGSAVGGVAYGVYALSDNIALYAFDVQGDSNPTAQIVGGTTDPATASLATYDSALSPTFWVDNGGNAHVRGVIFTSGSCNTGCAKTGDAPARQVQRYTPQESVPTIEDVGEAELSSGSAYVRIDPAFANVIDRRSPYLVFVTPQGLTRGLYVTNKTAEGFQVQELPGGHASVAFDYRIVAKPFGPSAPRLPMLTSGQVPKAPQPHHAVRSAALRP
jgi:hypothetical protein